MHSEELIGESGSSIITPQSMHVEVGLYTVPVSCNKVIYEVSRVESAERKGPPIFNILCVFPCEVRETAASSPNKALWSAKPGW